MVVMFYRILDFIKYLPREIKWFFQRGIRGYADCDCWAIDEWFDRVVIPMIQSLKENKHGYPVDMTEELWNIELERMIYYFTESTEEGCSEKNEYENIYDSIIWGEFTDNNEIVKKYLDRETQIDKYKYNMKQKGLRLFAKYFYNLWD